MMLLELMLQLREAVPPIETGTPTSIGAWIGMISGGTALVILAYDRLRGSGKREADLNNKVNELQKSFADLGRKVDILERELTVIEVNLSTIDRKLSEVLFELRGVDGQNGVKGAGRIHGLEIASIKKRLAAMDVLAALFKAERETYSGVERRHVTRRDFDVKLLEAVQTDDETPLP